MLREVCGWGGMKMKRGGGDAFVTNAVTLQERGCAVGQRVGGRPMPAWCLSSWSPWSTAVPGRPCSAAVAGHQRSVSSPV